MWITSNIYKIQCSLTVVEECPRLLQDADASSEMNIKTEKW